MRSIISQVKFMYSQKSLINQFIKREITGRYKGSYLGILWSFITPLLMLVIYTFVFSVVFKARWGTGADTSKVEFALLLFAGLIVFNIFSEVLVSASSLITSNVNYVKKVIFPLEILSIVSVGSSLFHGAISMIILIFAEIILMGTLHWTLILVPLIILPICLVALGLSWILASLGVYLRDIGQLIGVIVPGLMFLSPIFYPISAIPSELQYLYWINPITYVVEDVRRVVVWGKLPHWDWIVCGILIGITVSVIGLVWFKKTRKGFADVL